MRGAEASEVRLRLLRHLVPCLRLEGILSGLTSLVGSSAPPAIFALTNRLFHGSAVAEKRRIPEFFL
jgi:hypothetical protein